MRVVSALCLLLATSSGAIAQESGGGPLPVPVDDTSEIAGVIHPQAVATARALGLTAPAPPAQSPSRQSLRQVNYPLRLMPNSRNSIPNGISNFVDLDPTSGILDFSCGARTYDGHGGTDFFIAPFSWTMMDGQEVEIVAAAPGTIVIEQDGNYDRECLPLAQLPANLPANYVAILQDDGAYAYYYHMKSGTVTTLPIGTRVDTGQHLGFVGSSGHSTGPHLHFELNSARAGTTGGLTAIDPFAGQCGAATSLWTNQWEAQLDPRLIALTTHSAPPVVPSNNCDTTGQVPNYADNFNPGDTVYGVVALRDQRPSDVVTLQFVKPDGTILRSSMTGAPSSGFYQSSYWYNSVVLPTTPTGTWQLRAVLNTSDRGNFQLEKSFFVAAPTAATTVFSAVLPSGRSIIDTSTATLFAAIANGSGTTAYGCSIVPETPVAADFAFQTVTPQNTLTGTANEAVDIAAGGTQNFVIAFTPRLNFEALTQTANAVGMTLRYKCANADGVAQILGVNDLTLSFSPIAVPDIIALGATVTGDGVARVTSAGGTVAFAVATSNVGSAAPLIVTPAPSTTLPLTLSICETNAVTGACLAAPSANVARTFAAGETATWGIFAKATGGIPFDPGNSRISVNYVDSGGILRGGTSVAVTAP